MDGARGNVHIGGMTESLTILLYATALFVGGHFALSSLPVRQVLIDKIGENGHRGLYSVAAAAAMIWMIFAYGDARADNLHFWYAPVFAMIPVALMPIACIFLVCAVTTRNPTAVGGDKLVQDVYTPQGILTVTRHPMLIGMLLWALAHVPANGDMASLILFGGIGLLAIGGMLHIDHRRRIGLGAAWGPIALTTSAIPFWAALQGRTKVDWRGIGLFRILGGLALYGALVFAHGWIAGVPILHH